MTTITRTEFTRTDTSLRDAARMFAGHHNARVLSATTATAVLSRIALGRWSKRDAVATAVVLGTEPFVEWLIHVHVLHLRPRQTDEGTVDSLLARSHRAHHRDPRNPDLVLIPRQVLLPTVAVLAGANLAAGRAIRTALNGFAVSTAALTAYEWTHFLIHSSYRPKTALYRRIRKTHQLHHFRNENYWFGIMTPVSDVVLNTNPRKDDVPPSSTAKTLGVALQL